MARGTNTQGNNYSTPGGTNSSGGSSYHYSNSNGSYYYANDNGSTYHHSASGANTYTPAGKWSLVCMVHMSTRIDSLATFCTGDNHTWRVPMYAFTTQLADLVFPNEALHFSFPSHCCFLVPNNSTLSLSLSLLISHSPDITFTLDISFRSSACVSPSQAVCSLTPLPINLLPSSIVFPSPSLPFLLSPSHPPSIFS